MKLAANIDKILKTYLGFNDWFITQHFMRHDGEITEITIGRWFGYDLIVFTLRDD